MLRIRKVADATTAVNRSAIEAAQKIMREQFPQMPDYDIAKLPEQLANPLKHKFVSRLFVAENARDQTLGVALLLHAPDIGFSYLEIVSQTAPGFASACRCTSQRRHLQQELTDGDHQPGTRRQGDGPAPRRPCADRRA